MGDGGGSGDDGDDVEGDNEIIEPKFTCQRVGEIKAPKHLSSDLTPDWDDSKLKEILNGLESKFENDVEYFPETYKINGDFNVGEIFVKNPFQLSGEDIYLYNNLTNKYWMKSFNQVRKKK